MARASLNPNGLWLTRSSNRKIRCVNLNDANNYWTTFWGDNWNQADIVTQLAYYAARGVNTVKVYCDGMTPLQPTGNGLPTNTVYPADSVLVPRIQWFLQQCRVYGMGVYLAMNQSIEFANSGVLATTMANLAIQKKYLSWWLLYGSDVVVALDGCNEMNRGVPAWSLPNGQNYGTVATAAAIADMSLLNTMIRSTVPWPVTFSVYIKSRTTYGGGHQWLDLQYNLGCDFHDYHPYYDFPDPSTGLVPLSSDLVPLENRGKFIGRHLMGECGTGRDGVSEGSGAPFPTGWRVKFCNGLGDQAARQASFGANYFMSRPYNNGKNPSAFGIFDATLSNPDSATMASISRWPAA
jgi:hypothetical protein